MVDLGKIVALGGWIILFILGFRQATRKQNRLSDYGGGVFYFLGFLWAFASFVLYLSMYRGVEEPNLTRNFQGQKTAYIWRTYRNEQLWLRFPNQQETLLTILPPFNQGCQNLNWLDENTLVLLLKTDTGIFQHIDPNNHKPQFFSLWITQAKPSTSLEPITPEALASLRKLIQEKSEQLGSDLDNLKVVAEEYEFSNMEKILNSEENPKMDAYVASIIGDLEGQKALPLLVQSVQKKEKQVYSAAFGALLRLKNRYREIPYLLYQSKIQTNKEFEFRFQLLQIFGESEDARLIEPLIAWMGNEEELTDYRKEAFKQLQKLTKKDFDYDFSERRSRQSEQLREIQAWYEKEKATLLAPYPKPTIEPKETPEVKQTPPENSTDKTETPVPEKQPTPEIPPTPEKQPTESTKIEMKPVTVAILLQKEIQWRERESELKELCRNAHEKMFRLPVMLTKDSMLMKNGVPESQWIQGKKELKEALKRYLARSIWSLDEKQLIWKVLASFQKSTLPLVRVATYETLTEWAKGESAEQEIQSLIIPLREEDR